MRGGPGCQHLACIRPDPRLADADFLRAALAGRCEVLRFQSEGAGSTKGALTCEQLKHFQVPLSPPPEQRSIVEHLQQKTAQVDSLAARIRTGIQRLREYRVALVSAGQGQ